VFASLPQAIPPRILVAQAHHGSLHHHEALEHRTLKKEKQLTQVVYGTSGTIVKFHNATRHFHFGFWILDFGLGLRIFGFWIGIEDFWILDWD
jgi:hypothetical protein